ncbi:MAG TPA: MBL fold metallo-hydrolase [Geminicoccaceae bacterium]|nr:MBL fold metallo-hydrolase [Geminicoccaceae bacterium]
MHFSLEVLRARKGDCLLLHFGSRDDPHLIVVDGGPSSVYRPHLRPRLERIRAERGLEEDQPLPVDALLVSHVDDDHIKGILELSQEQRAHGALPLDVGGLWHNSFDDILDTTPKELDAAAGFGAAALAGEIELDGEPELDAAKVLASIPQGRQLRDDALALGWPVNAPFGRKLILATGKAKPVALGGGLQLLTVGPMWAELKALQAAHDKWLKARKGKQEPAAALAAYVDRSVANLSSIVLLAEAGGRRMLLTGDARGDRILQGLELAGLIEQGGAMHVDLLKVPHHGSANNLETDFFRRITADHYVFSGDGEHGNPEREALGMLAEARGEAGYTIHLTYPIDEIDARRQEDWRKEQAKEINRKKKNPKLAVRADWSPEKHGLAAFLADRPALADRVRIVAPDRPHVIDLGTPLKEAWPSLPS